METEAIRVGIVMQRTPLGNRWQPYLWQPIEIIDAALLPDGTARCLRSEDSDLRWLFPAFDVKLSSDEAEGYFLNVTSPAPCWFVMWRSETLDGLEIAVPKTVTLSYNEAARLMDGGEQVDTLPASGQIVERLAAFAQEHYRPEPKKKRKKPSFEGGAGIDRMAKAEGGPDGG